MTKRRLIQASKRMREAESRIQPDAAWVLRTRQNLLKTVRRDSTLLLQPTFTQRYKSLILTFLPARTIDMVRGPVMAVLSVFGIVIGGSLASVSAAERSLPGDLLFPVKLAGEQARLMMANESPDKLKLKTEFVGKRMNEMKKIATADLPNKNERLKEAAGIVKKDLDAVKVQISNVASDETSVKVAKAAKAFDDASVGLIKTAKEVQAIAPKELRIEVAEVQVAAVSASVRAVQVMIDTHNDPASEGVITKEAIKKTIEDKVQVLQTGMEETQQKVVASEERIKATLKTDTGSSTRMMITEGGRSTSTTPTILKEGAPPDLAQFNAVKETLETTKRLLQTDDLSQMKETLGEAAKAVSTFEKSVAKTLSDAENAPPPEVKPVEDPGSSTTTSVTLPSSTQVNVSSTAAVSSSSGVVVRPTTPTSSAPGGT